MGEIESMGEIEIPETITVGAQERFSRYLVGFVAVSDDGRMQDAAVAGSGTLVALGRTRAILTATHVLQYLSKFDDVGLVLPIPGKKPLQDFIVRREHCRSFSFGNGDDKPDGPDIGCLVLNEVDADRIVGMNKIFYNLEKRAEPVLARPYHHEIGLWYLGGLLGERTTDVPSPIPKLRTKAITYAINEVEILSEDSREGFDYFDCRPKKGDHENVPKSFGGTSGGALWHIIVGRHKDGSLVAWKEFLSGVPYYEFKDNQKTVRCHGRKSIYDKIRTRLADVAA